jgi:flagellar motility protein MotE (MotC chaperone)
VARPIVASWLVGLRTGTVALCVLGAASGRAVAEKVSASDVKPAAAAKNDSKSDGAPGKASPPSAKPEGAPAKIVDAPAKAEEGSAGKTDGPSAKSDGARAEGEAAVAAKDKTQDKAKAKAKATSPKKKASAPNAEPKIGEGPSPASPPPLTMTGLREEIRREAAPVTIDPEASARTKVELMLAEIAKTREAMREDTTRLELMMGDGADSAAGGASGAAATAGASATSAASGRPAAKNPLDVLAKALRGIKPELAAPIVARLDKRLAATVLLRMPPVDAGKIMGALKPDTAAELATQIAMRAPPGEVKR